MIEMSDKTLLSLVTIVLLFGFGSALSGASSQSMRAAVALSAPNDPSISIMETIPDRDTDGVIYAKKSETIVFTVSTSGASAQYTQYLLSWIGERSDNAAPVGLAKRAVPVGTVQEEVAPFERGEYMLYVEALDTLNREPFSPRVVTGVPLSVDDSGIIQNNNDNDSDNRVENLAIGMACRHGATAPHDTLLSESDARVLCNDGMWVTALPVTISLIREFGFAPTQVPFCTQQGSHYASETEGIFIEGDVPSDCDPVQALSRALNLPRHHAGSFVLRSLGLERSASGELIAQCVLETRVRPSSLLVYTSDLSGGDVSQCSYQGGANSGTYSYRCTGPSDARRSVERAVVCAEAGDPRNYLTAVVSPE